MSALDEVWRVLFGDGHPVWTSDHELFAEYGIHDTEYSRGDVFVVYRLTVDKDEYPTIAGWVWDMERSGTLFRHEG